MWLYTFVGRQFIWIGVLVDYFNSADSENISLYRLGKCQNLNKGEE